jgi:hypothetical protein
MSGLAGHVEDYLRLRRALGFKLRFPGQVLPSLAAYLEAAGATAVTAELAIAWAGQPQGVHPIVWSHRPLRSRPTGYGRPPLPAGSRSSSPTLTSPA